MVTNFDQGRELLTRLLTFGSTPGSGWMRETVVEWMIDHGLELFSHAERPTLIENAGDNQLIYQALHYYLKVVQAQRPNDDRTPERIRELIARIESGAH